MQASLYSSTIHSHADIPKAATLGKRKASDDHSRPEKKKIMMVSGPPYVPTEHRTGIKDIDTSSSPSRSSRHLPLKFQQNLCLQTTTSFQHCKLPTLTSSFFRAPKWKSIALLWGLSSSRMARLMNHSIVDSFTF